MCHFNFPHDFTKEDINLLNCKFSYDLTEKDEMISNLFL